MQAGVMSWNKSESVAIISPKLQVGFADIVLMLKGLRDKIGLPRSGLIVVHCLSEEQRYRVVCLRVEKR